MSEEVVFDFARDGRLGFGEAVLCAGKSTAQLERILGLAEEKEKALLLTRLAPDAHRSLPAHYSSQLDYDPVSRTAFFNLSSASAVPAGIGVVCAGTSDIPVAREAERTLQFHGLDPESYYDLGVAGLWRLGERLPALRKCQVVIVVAGMDGALPSVIGGLLGALVIAVPVSTGYGAAENGRTALHAALASCAPGLVTVNIDNGYGAAIAALRACKMAEHGNSRST